MTRQHDTEHLILPHISRATEHSVPFSDLRANPDTRLIRLWLRGEVHDDLWLPIDVARDGLTAAGRLRSVEHNNTRQNTELLKQVALSAFTLYQRDKLTDEDGNLVAFALPRNASLQLGQIPRGHFDALKGSSLGLNHVALQVDDNDMLGIEAHDLDNLPQIEVIDVDDEAAVESGNARRDYVSPRDIGAGYITRSEQPIILQPLSSSYGFIAPRPTHSPQTAKAPDNSLCS